MTFWLDRFCQEDKEDIWEQLKQLLINPSSEQEIAMKKQQEQAEIDSVLNKMFPDEKKSIIKEPYLKYEDLFDKQEFPNESIKSLVQPAENVLTNISNPLEELKETFILNNSDTVAGQIKDKLGNTLNKDNLKKAAGVGLQAASLIPQVRNAGMLAKGAGAIGKKLAPKVGRKIAKEIGDGAVAGTISGALEGLGRGLITDENPLKTTLQDAGIGAVLGTTGGAVGGKITHNKRVANLNELTDKRKDWGIAFTKQSGKPAEAIDKLLEQKQGFVPKATKKKGIGNIDFVWGDKDKGLQHIIERRNSQGHNGESFVKELPELFKKSDTYKKKSHPNREYIGSANKEAVIRTDYNQKPQNWLTSAYYLEDAPSQASAGFRTYDPNYSNKQFFPLSDLRKSNNIITSSQTNLNPSQQAIQKQNSFNEWLEELKRKRKNVADFKL